MDYQNTMRFRLEKEKRIGSVLFIVEGEATEPNLIYKVFSGIFGYQVERIHRNGIYRVFHRTDDPYSRITVINTEESNIRFIEKDNEYLNNMFSILIEEYGFDIDNAAIYYLFDRDPESNTDVDFIEDILRKLANARDINEDMMRQGLLLLSYPCIESFIGMNLLSESIQYCWNKEIKLGRELKQALNSDKILSNKINENTILHCTEELLSCFKLVGIDIKLDQFMNSLDNFSQNNSRIFLWEEQQYCEKGQYGLLSLLIIALIDLGLIKIDYIDNNCR